MFDILSFCRDHGIDYAFKGKNIGPGWLGLQCPFHRDDAYHMGFNLSGGYVYCWKCGGHSLESVIRGYLSCEEYEARAMLRLYDTFAILTDEMAKKKAGGSNLILPGEPLTKPYRKYLIKRGLDPDEIVEKYGVKAGGIVGDWKYRLMIPIYQDKLLVSYQGRDISGTSPLRYKTLSVEKSAINPKFCLYNLDNAKDFQYIGVCEGVVDVWKLGDGFVATLGTSTTEEQVRKLSRYKTVYIVFDPEENAQKRARKLGERVSAMGSRVEIIDTGLDHDPGDMTEAEVGDLRKELGMVSGV